MQEQAKHVATQANTRPAAHELKPAGMASSLTLLLMAALLFASTLFTAFAAHAQGGGALGNVGARCQQIRQQVESQDQDKAYIVEYIVTCTKTVVEEVAQEFINGFYPLVETGITAALTLAVTLFGVLMLTGMLEKSSRDGFVALFKLACVLFFVQPDIVMRIFEMGMDAMDGLTDLVFQFGKGSGGSGKCYDDDTLWDRLDCMLDVLIGTVKEGGSGALSAAAGGSDLTGQARGMIPSSMFYLASTGIGGLIGLIGLYVIITVLMAAIKSIHTYLAAIIALAFILTFAPLFIPMIMFKVTRTYFDKWQRIATSFVLQPVILFAFLSLMLIALEDMLIENDGSYIKMTCGEEATQRDKHCAQVLEENGALREAGLDKNTGLRWSNYSLDHASGMQYETREGGFLGNRQMFSAAGNSGKPQGGLASFGIPLAEVDMDKAASLSGSGDGTTHQERAALSAITLALTAFVFTSMLNYIPTMATELSGGLYEVPNLYSKVGQHLPGKQALNRMGSEVSQQVKQTIGLVNRR